MGMLQVEPLRRYTMKDLRTHPWLIGISSIPTGSPGIKRNKPDLHNAPSGEIIREKKKSKFSNFFSRIITSNDSTPPTTTKEEPVKTRTLRRQNNKRWTINVGVIKVADANP